MADRFPPAPSTAAWKAALAALGDNPPLCLMEDPSSIAVALKAAYAVDFGALPPLTVERLTEILAELYQRPEGSTLAEEAAWLLPRLTAGAFRQEMEA
jgi:hypothetical protein